MNNFMYRVMNADIPVIGVSVHICVKRVIGYSLDRVI